MPDENDTNTEASIENVAQAVHDLSEAVTEMQSGRVDEEVVRRIAGEVLEAQAAAAGAARRRSFTPDGDEDPEDSVRVLQGRERMLQLHSRPAERVAPLARVQVDDVRRFQEASDRLVLLTAVLRAQGRIDGPRDLSYFSEEYLPAMQAVSSTGVATGDEFVPTDLSANLIERVNLALRVAALFASVPMPTQPFDIPGRAVSRVRGGKADEQTADTGQTKFKKVTPGTRKVTLSAVKFAVEALVSKETEEDALIAILPFLEEEIVDYTLADIEDAIVNGDLSGTHQDTDVTASDDPRKNFKGLRKRAIAAAKTDASAANLTVAMLRTNRKNMGKYGVSPADLAHVVSINSYIQLLADSNVITVDKYGPQATILSGELGKADGAPLVVSEYVRTDLDATGVNGPTAGNNIKTEAFTVYRRGFVLGERRGMSVQLLRELYAESDQDAIIATTRRAFEARFTDTSEPIVALHYNLAR